MAAVEEGATEAVRTLLDRKASLDVAVRWVTELIIYMTVLQLRRKELGTHDILSLNSSLLPSTGDAIDIFLGELT